MTDGLHAPDPTLAIGAVMAPFPIVVSVDMPLDEVAELLAQNDITGAPVVDGEGRLVGVISQTDLVRTVAAPSSVGRRWAGYTARLALSRPGFSASSRQGSATG